MENTKSKITVNLYGNKHQVFIPYSDPNLDEIVDAFVGILKLHHFDLEDIHEAFVEHLVSTMKESDEDEPNNSVTGYGTGSASHTVGYDSSSYNALFNASTLNFVVPKKSKK